VTTKQFYEEYWRTEHVSAVGDPTAAERMVRLREALDALFPGRRSGSVRVLDAGCGAGEFLAFLGRVGFAVAGVDLSAEAVERARRRNPDADVRVGSIEEHIPFRGETFDAVWCTEVLEHVFDVHATLTELNRMLRPSGALVLTTPYHGVLKNMLIAPLNFDRHFNPEGSHIRFFTRRTLARVLVRAGFTPLTWQGIGRVRPIWKSFFVVARKTGTPGPPPEIVG
jgi:2-polyprenyl-3-methyl-5-hydroxy-6-metoxy-1,4-benzoquinol methylase